MQLRIIVRINSPAQVDSTVVGREDHVYSNRHQYLSPFFSFFEFFSDHGKVYH